MPIIIEGPAEARDARFDYLTKRAGQVLNDLLPSSKVRIAYDRAQFEGVRHGYAAFRTDHTPFGDGHIINGSQRKVPNTDDLWSRTFSVEMLPDLAVFLGADKNMSERLPPELRGIISITEDLVGIWARRAYDQQQQRADLSPGLATSHDELRWALESQLPISIVSHVAAARMCPVGRSQKGDSEHNRLARTLVLAIEYLQDLSRTRVEHEQLSHGVVVTRHTGPSGVNLPNRVTYPDAFRSLKRSAPLSNGDDTALVISTDGTAVEWVMAPPGKSSRRRTPFAALGLVPVVAADRRGLGLALRKDGTVIVFHGGLPLFVQRGARWRGMIWGGIRRVMAERFGRLGKLLFDISVLLSATGRGGILCVTDTVPPGVLPKDRVDQARAEVAKDKHDEWVFHQLLPSDQMTRLSVASLAALAAIDGATIVSPDGKLLAYGAVVPSKPSGAEGARTSAARELSMSGFVLKISADGPITVFQEGKIIVEM
jgi:hypothetical protein